MVDEYENTGTKMTVREGFRIGWSRTAWRLFLINLIVNLARHTLFRSIVGWRCELFPIGTKWHR